MKTYKLITRKALTAAVLAAMLCATVFLPVLSGCEKPAAQKKTTAVGDHIYFGSYPQTADGEVMPIEWRVLDVQDGSALLISEYLLDCKKYNETDTVVTWETCTLRKWLNDDFYNTAFSADEQKKIVTVSHDNPDNLTYDVKGGDPTDDCVFCLSPEQANEYFVDDKDRRAEPTAYTKKKGAYVSVSNGNGWWWLGMPGGGGDCAVSVSYNGVIHEEGRNVSIHLDCVRPVIMVSLSDQLPGGSTPDPAALGDEIFQG